MDHFIVAQLAGFEEDWHFSHAVRLNGLLLLSGVTGTKADGTVAAEPAEQFEQAFEHLGLYLGAAGVDFGDIAELTSYHVGLRAHLDVFTAVKDRYIQRPFPAWSAIGVAELITGWRWSSFGWSLATQPPPSREDSSLQRQRPSSTALKPR